MDSPPSWGTQGDNPNLPPTQPHFWPPRCSSTSQELAAKVGLHTDQRGSRLFPILTFCSWTPYSHLEIRSICSSTHTFPPGLSSPRKEGDSKESLKCTPKSLFTPLPSLTFPILRLHHSSEPDQIPPAFQRELKAISALTPPDIPPTLPLFPLVAAH